MEEYMPPPNSALSDLEELFARASTHEFVLEILLANSWADLSESEIDHVRNRILSRLTELRVEAGPADPTVVERVANRMHAQCAHLLEAIS